MLGDTPHRRVRWLNTTVPVVYSQRPAPFGTAGPTREKRCKRASRSSARGCALECGDIELLHFEERLGHPREARLVATAQEFLHDHGSDLP